MTTYTDRDYFDEQFSNIDNRFDALEKKLDAVNHAVFGNGQIGLTEKVRQLQGYMRMVFILIGGLFPFSVSEFRTMFFNGIKSIIDNL